MSIPIFKFYCTNPRKFRVASRRQQRTVGKCPTCGHYRLASNCSQPCRPGADTMSENDKFWAISNTQSCDLLVWLEPWAEEFSVPYRSRILFEINSPASQNNFPEVEVEKEWIVVWANGGDLIRVSIDNVFQHSSSAEIVVPDIPNLSPKQFLQTAFGVRSAPRIVERETGAKSTKSFLYRLRGLFAR